MCAFAAERRWLLHGARSASAAVDQYLLPTGRSAANPLHAAAAVDRCDRQTDKPTDGQTDGRSTVTKALLGILRGQRQ